MDVRGIDSLELKKITRQVMEELQKRLEGTRSRTESHPQAQGGKGFGRLLVLGMPASEEKAFLEKDFSVKYDSATEEWSYKGVEGADLVCGCDILLLMELSPETMAYVTHGIFGNRAAACILRGLLEGKKIFLMQKGLAYRKYRETASKNLYALYLQQEDTFRNLGVEVIGHVADLERSMRSGPSLLSGGRSQAIPETGGFLDFRHLGLVREADLFRARTSGVKVIKLGRTTKITPLAMDFINNYNFSLMRE